MPGALAAVDPRDPAAVATVKAQTTDGAGTLATIDLVGAGTSVQFALDCAARGGQIIVVGLIGGEITIPVPAIPQRALTLQGSYVGNLDELAALMKVVSAGTVGRIPTKTVPLAEANAALDALRGGQVVGRIVLQP